MSIQQYLDHVSILYKTGNAREHSYRGDLQTLLTTLLPGVLVTNEPARISCGAPDYVLTRNDVPVGYIEAKDIGVDLNHKILKEQFDRYKAGLSNLIFTDYLDFHFYKDGILTTSVTIASRVNGKIIALPENFERFTALLQNFVLTITQTIKSPTKLAEMMAGKAKLMADVIEKSLHADDEAGTRSALKSQMLSFQQMLIHDIDNAAFADIYAQTIAYGMFAARYHDPTLPTFTRQEAATLIPRSNPFLRKLFQDIAGYDLDNRLVWIVDELVNIFLATDVADIMRNFGKSTKQEDPVIHFYETFLAAYNPALRKSRGVWYTPQPVVNFIVRAVDDLLKTEFNLPQGLADTSKAKVKLKVPTHDKRYAAGLRDYEQEVHKVQILDPATGTGTFLAETVRYIYKKFEGQQGIWSNYVSQHLIPRLNGFELLMASYAMAHLKMDMLLTETGYKATTDQRFRIFLTNSLEEAHRDTSTLFSSWLSDEADQANVVKRDTPVMVIMGNPPYNGESPNKGKWIMKLMEDYKKEPGGKVKLKEKNSKWINADEYKFIRYGQHYIEKNGSGILAFINPHGFLDNPTFRGMRWNLLKMYDKIYTIDLHGNSRKKEISPDGTVDVNVFDIMQGVSINLFIKTGKKNEDELGKVFHFDLYGKREFKYDFLLKNCIKTIPYEELMNFAPNYYFVNKDFEEAKKYNTGFYIRDLFLINSLGIQTHRDNFAIDINKQQLANRIKDFFNVEAFNDTQLIQNYKLKPSKEWNLNIVRKAEFDDDLIIDIDYRIFDIRKIYYSKNIIDRGRDKVMKNLLQPNLALTVSKQQSSSDFRHIFISKNIQESCLISLQTKEQGDTFPIYLYPDTNGQKTFEQTTQRKPNLNSAIVKQIAEDLSLTFTPEKEETENTFAPIDLLDYIYAVLHSPVYRETYKEFLKIDFPRVPYPADADEFWRLVKIGEELRRVHLLESAVTEKYITQYPVDGYNGVSKVKFVPAVIPLQESSFSGSVLNAEISPDGKNDATGRVYINDTQYFNNVPLSAWEFYIGGYQPAQKWLKDRKGRELVFEDILHYQKIIVALWETERLMGKVDKATEII